ncbi:MAG: methylmalonyl-CoA mutase family protein [Chloroflexi bacterium]|nr:methylmalonyl-CoA mutase family protein [Chloroflexota bacterium]
MTKPSPPLADALSRWEDTTLRPTLARHPERKDRFQTSSGITVNRLYLPPADDEYLQKQGLPGAYPFTRGVQPTMYRGRLWTMRQYAGFGSAAQTNQRFKYLLAQGQTGLSVAFDLPTQIGYDADHPLAAGEVGKVGVSISSLADMEILLAGIPLDQVSVSMTINAPASILLAMVLGVAQKQGVEPAHLRGTVQNDILKEYVARGTYIYPPRHSMRLITDLFSYCNQNMRRWNTISISGYHIREAGSTAVQEVAFTLANGIAYVRAALAVGLDIDDFAAQLSFFFNAHNNFLEEIAKFRAARRLWARIMREQFGARRPRSWMLRFHTQTGGSTLTAQQPQNNIVRVTLQALAAVMGGTQSLHTNSMDEALSLPTEKAVRTALRTQQILAYESGVADTVDPLAGAYFIEYLTDEIERQASETIERIEAMGGAVQAVEQGTIQREIQNAAYQTQQAIESGQEIVVGVNRFQVTEEAAPKIMRMDASAQEAQIASVRALKAQRDRRRVAELLTRIENAARDAQAPLLPLFVEAVQEYVTLGEISDVLRQVFGEYQAPTLL